MAVEQDQAPPQPLAEAEASPVEEVPVLAVRDTVIFPGALLPITIGRPSSVALVQSLGENRTLAVVAQQDPRIDMPGPENDVPHADARTHAAKITDPRLMGKLNRMILILAI